MTIHPVCYFSGLVPLFVISFLNWRIIAAMNAATRRHNNIASLKRRDRAMSALLTGVVVVLVICHTPKTIINLSESYHILRYGLLSKTDICEVVRCLFHRETAQGASLGKYRDKVQPSPSNYFIGHQYSHLFLQSKGFLFRKFNDFYIHCSQDFKFRSVLVKTCASYSFKSLSLSQEESANDKEGNKNVQGHLSCCCKT